MKKKEVSTNSEKVVESVKYASNPNEIDFDDEFMDKVKGLTYEETINELDKILEFLQSESIPLEEIQSTFLQGKVCLEHCNQLLLRTEQRVIELSLDENN